ncbi:MAG: DUF3822 family protein [Ferruginibacter sp.]
MNLLFNIQAPQINPANGSLYLEIDSDGLSYIIVENGLCMAMLVYQFSEGSTDEGAAGFIHQVISDQPVLQQRFNKVYIIYGFKSSILVPHEFMSGTNAKEMLELVYGEASESIIRTDFMNSMALHVLYRVPSVIDMVITRYFGSAQHTHIYSLLPKIVKDQGTHLYCIFSSGKLKAMLMKDGRVAVMQHYSYNTQDDVAYHMLNICKSYGVQVEEVLMHVCGMVDENAALFAELYKYFPEIQFEVLPSQFQYPAEFNQYPAYYFSHLFAIAACV